MLKLEILPLLFLFSFRTIEIIILIIELENRMFHSASNGEKKKKEKEEKANFRSKYGDLLNRQTRDPRAEVNGERRGKYKFLESAGRKD